MKGLKFVMDKSIQVLKSTKARPLSKRVFSQTCSACTYGIHNSEVQWLPRGKVHQCIVALRNKGGNILAKNIIPLLLALQACISTSIFQVKGVAEQSYNRLIKRIVRYYKLY
jgi:hypothetical protein